jgi:outer membrane protein assembly factor BamA
MQFLAVAQNDPGQATTPTQTKPPEPKGTPTQSPAETPKTSPQVKETLPSYEGQNVTSVEVAGQPNIEVKDILPLLTLKANEPFSQAKANASIGIIKQNGRFHDVQLEVRPETNGIRVLFIVQPATYFGIFLFPGATSDFPYSRLLQVAKYPPKGAYTPVDVETARKALERFFQRNGYFEAKVESQVQTNPPWGLANVTFHTTLNQRARFGKVQFNGVTGEERTHLEKQVGSIWARLRGAAIREGRKYKLKTVQKATQYLTNSLSKRGYLDAKVHMKGADYSPESNRANIAFDVQPGPVVHIRVSGARLWSWNRRKLLPVYQHTGVDPELIQEGEKNLTSYFQSKGFFSVKVTSNVAEDAEGKTISYQINRGPRHRVEKVAIAGNEHNSEKDLSPYIKVKRARLFSHGQFSDQLVRTSVRNIENAYKADGYSSVKVSPQVEKHKGNVLVTFHVEEGPQDIVESMKVEGNQTLSESELAPEGFKVTEGQPYSQKNVAADRNQIVATYLNRGYLTATFHGKVTQGSAPHQLRVVYEIYEGPQVNTATVVTLGKIRTKQKLIDRETTAIEAGKPLRVNDLLTSETQLYNTGVFDWAEVDPRRDITTQHKEDVLIKVHETKPNTLTYGFGFDVINRGGSVPSGTVVVPGIPPAALPKNFKTSEKTFWGPRGTLEYTRNNLSGKGDSLSFSSLAARLQQSASAVYTDPAFFWTKWSSSVSITAQHNSENPIFTFREAQFGYQLQRPMNSDRNQNLFLRYNFSETGLTNLLIPELVPPDNQHVRLSTLSTSYIRDTRDNPTDAQKGIYESFELDVNPAFLGSNFSFARLLAQTAYYKKIPGNAVWANSLRMGLEQPFGSSSVPLSETFFSGGGSTLRGFPLNGAGPQHVITACGDPADQSTCAPITVPVGGPQLLIVNSELRVPIPVSFPLVGRNLGIALFYDGGNVFPTIGFHNFGANYSNSIGGGLRYKTPVGPIRIDVGHNLNAPPGIKSTQFFITLGQAF